MMNFYIFLSQNTVLWFEFSKIKSHFLITQKKMGLKLHFLVQSFHNLLFIILLIYLLGFMHVSYQVNGYTRKLCPLKALKHELSSAFDCCLCVRISLLRAERRNHEIQSQSSEIVLQELIYLLIRKEVKMLSRYCSLDCLTSVYLKRHEKSMVPKPPWGLE